MQYGLTRNKKELKRVSRFQDENFIEKNSTFQIDCFYDRMLPMLSHNLLLHYVLVKETSTLSLTKIILKTANRVRIRLEENRTFRTSDKLKQNFQKNYTLRFNKAIVKKRKHLRATSNQSYLYLRPNPRTAVSTRNPG